VCFELEYCTGSNSKKIKRPEKNSYVGKKWGSGVLAFKKSSGTLRRRSGASRI